MYPGEQVKTRRDQPAFIMAESGEIVTYGELEVRSNRIAHLLRAQGLNRLDHYSIFMENHPRYIECCSAGERSGLYYTCINSYLTPEEVAYIINNSQSQVLFTSEKKREVAMAAVKDCPNIKLVVVVDGSGNGDDVVNLDEAVSTYPDTPISDEYVGVSMLYSSGTTGQPKGILRPLPAEPAGLILPMSQFLKALWQYRPDMIYLSPAPLYHSAPQGAVGLTISTGGTAIIMTRFDPERYLELIEQYQVTHSQLVPTMFSRMLKLPEDVHDKYDLSSLEFTVHAAAPCPIQVKQQMIDWWGPVIHEYYGATEGLGFTTLNSEEWLAHRGSVGKVVAGVLHILDDDMQPCAVGETGTLWFETANAFKYFNDPAKTAEALSEDGSMSTVGDMGYIDEDGFVYLTDRKTFMIISGGVNIYPQECENLLIEHPRISDAAVFGVPNEDLGEEVKAVVQMMPGEATDETMAEELIAHCHDHLAKMKCPQSIDFIEEMPRLPTGKLYKTSLRDKYWGEGKSRIV